MDPPVSSPISKLNHDILWSIFSLNSNPISFEIDYGNLRHLPGLMAHVESPLREPSLLIARRTSQVCRQWRDVVLNAPSLWANAIDLQYLDQVSGDWRNEVLTRTANAPLAVIGSFEEGRMSFVLSFFMHLLDAHWERIRSLVISSAIPKVDEKLLIALTHRAPLLELFTVELRTQHQHISHHQNIITPFANHAPRLFALNTDTQVVDMSSLSRTAHIRNLSFTLSQTTISVSELFESLHNMPLLETLNIIDVTPSRKNVVLVRKRAIPHVNLVRLYSLKIEENAFTPTADILSHITIPPQCAVNITNSGDSNFIMATMPGYADFVKANFSSWTITKISYKVEHTQSLPGMGILGRFYRQHFSLYRDQDTIFHPHFEYYNLTLGTPGMPFYMADALCFCNLRHVKTFILTLEDDWGTFVAHTSIDDMYDLLRSLEYVTTFRTNEKTLEIILAEEPSLSDLMFPRLETLVVDKWETDSVDDFLSLWKDDRRPFTRVVFSEMSDVPVGDSSILRTASRAGMTVAWLVGGEEGMREFPPINYEGASEESGSE